MFGYSSLIYFCIIEHLKTKRLTLGEFGYYAILKNSVEFKNIKKTKVSNKGETFHKNAFYLLTQL